MYEAEAVPELNKDYIVKTWRGLGVVGLTLCSF